MAKEDLKDQFYGSTIDLTRKAFWKFVDCLKTVPFWETVFWFIFIVILIYFFLGALPAVLEK